MPFLEGALKAAREKVRNSAVVKSLRRSENLQLREEVIRCRQRCCHRPPVLSDPSDPFEVHSPTCVTCLAICMPGIPLHYKYLRL